MQSMLTVGRVHSVSNLESKCCKMESKCCSSLKKIGLLTFEWFSNKIDPLPDLGSGGGEWLGVVGRRLDSMGSEWTWTGTHPQSVVTLPRTKTQQWTATWSARFTVSGPSHQFLHASWGTQEWVYMEARTGNQSKPILLFLLSLSPRWRSMITGKKAFTGIAAKWMLYKSLNFLQVMDRLTFSGAIDANMCKTFLKDPCPLGDVRYNCTSSFDKWFALCSVQILRKVFGAEFGRWQLRWWQGAPNL